MGRTKVRFGRPKRGSSAKESLQKAQSKAEATSHKKSYKKLPGFDAFSGTQTAWKGKNKNKRLVECQEASAPSTGIHSLSWAAAIVPQQSGFLRLPFEIRLKIYTLVITSFNRSNPTIYPRKNRSKFKSPHWRLAAQETASLYEICRQTYVDVVGSGLLYSTKTFIFTSPKLMLNYLWVINPVHRSCIRTIELWIPLKNNNKTLPSNAVSFLAECKGLRHLKLCLHVDITNCDFERLPRSRCHWRVKEMLLKKIKDWEALRRLRVREFEFKIVPECGYFFATELCYKVLGEELRSVLVQN